MKKSASITGVLFCLVLIMSACSFANEGKALDDTRVACDNGIMIGKSENGVVSFKGVPYAKPPVGELRWRAPQPPDPSDAEVECFEFGASAIQYETVSEPASYSPKSEDCLTLNIWKSENADGNDYLRPVMVFFHGGAFGWGGTSDPMYDGASFVSAHSDIILVTCNYRLGIMAWPDFSQIEGGEDYTDVNLGVRDQIAALKWIHENITSFGGDPGNVTIFGESAGGWSTMILAISPAAKGLFNKAISESGGFPAGTREDAREYAAYIMETAGVRNMEELLSISGER